MLKRELSLSKEELKITLDKYTQSASLAYTTPTEIKTLKDEFRLTIKQLESLQDELAEKQIEIKSIRAQLLDKQPQLSAAHRRIQEEDLE